MYRRLGTRIGQVRSDVSGCVRDEQDGPGGTDYENRVAAALWVT